MGLAPDLSSPFLNAKHKAGSFVIIRATGGALIAA
jgi:hypothetical protein